MSLLTSQDIVNIFNNHGEVNDVAELFYERIEKTLPEKDIHNMRATLDDSNSWDKFDWEFGEESQSTFSEIIQERPEFAYMLKEDLFYFE